MHFNSKKFIKLNNIEKRHNPRVVENMNIELYLAFGIWKRINLFCPNDGIFQYKKIVEIFSIPDDGKKTFHLLKNKEQRENTDTDSGNTSLRHETIQKEIG